MTERKIFATAEHREPDYTMRRPKGAIWCPYDGEWTVFEPKKKDGYTTYPRCELCGISDEDFWVKMANKSWGIPEGTMKARKKK